MNRLLAASALAIAFAAGTVSPASANFEPCRVVNCAATCLPGCIPDPLVGCFHLQPYAYFCV